MLTVYHALKSDRLSYEAMQHVGKEIFRLETCLRAILVSTKPIESLSNNDDIECFVEGDAYRFLLKVSCGLKSILRGEPEVFSQLKRTWEAFEASQKISAKALRPYIISIFGDTKRIRSEHLQGLGGSSYYAATQKLIELKKDDTVLLIGAGQLGCMLANSMIKRVGKLIVANRTAHTMDHLKDNMKSLANRMELAALDEGLSQQIMDVDHLLVSIPSGEDSALDALIIDAWQKRNDAKKHGFMVHYCEYVERHSNWINLPNMFTLADIMHYQTATSESQDEAFLAAQNACRALAKNKWQKLSNPSSLAQVAA